MILLEMAGVLLLFLWSNIGEQDLPVQRTAAAPSQGSDDQGENDTGSSDTDNAEADAGEDDPVDEGDGADDNICDDDTSSGDTEDTDNTYEGGIIPVPLLSQDELYVPTGCELVSAYMLLEYYGCSMSFQE